MPIDDLLMKVFCPFGSVVEHSLGKGEVAGPIPAMGTSLGCSKWFVALIFLVKFVSRLISER
jgi:hypothetical protein